MTALAMTARDAAIDAFLQRSGWGGAQRVKLAGDASFRRYERVHRNGAPAVLMDAPPEKEDIRPFVAVTRLLESFDLRPPRILAEDEREGFLLLEDLGDDLYARVLKQDASREMPLYEAAVDVLGSLLHHTAPSSVPAYTDEKLVQESQLFAQWCVGPAMGERAGEDAAQSLGEALRPLLAQARLVPEVLTLRDYHAENLLWLGGETGHARVGLLDYQDAVRGPCTYDLVSLLEDARRDVPPDVAQAMKRRFFAFLTGVSEEEFEASYAIMGAQRNLKIIGIFHRLHKRDGKAHYLSLIPRVAAHLERDLAHPALAGLNLWMTPWRKAAA